MKSLLLFYGFLCLAIRFSSVFGVDNSKTDTAVQSLIKEFQSLRIRVSVLESVVEKQAETIQAQNDSIVRLEAMVKSLSFNDKESENLKDSLRDGVDVANQSLDNSTEANPLQLDRQNISASFISRKAPLGKMPNRLIRQAKVKPVAFYAYMSSSINNPGGLHTLIFDVIKTNEGNGYHKHIGVFIVPKSGTYFFSWTMNLWYLSYHSTQLVVNNQVQGSIYRHTNANERDSVTGNIILNLNKRDVVFIRTKINHNFGQIISDAFGKTSFSGFLIK